MARQPEFAVKFLLNHHSYLPGAEGVMGQTIECRRELAEKLAASGGGKIINKPEPKGESDAS